MKSLSQLVNESFNESKLSKSVIDNNKSIQRMLKEMVKFGSRKSSSEYHVPTVAYFQVLNKESILNTTEQERKELMIFAKEMNVSDERIND